MAALRFSIDGFEIPNQTIYWSMKFFLLNVYCVFYAAARKIDVFSQTYRTRANATTTDMISKITKNAQIIETAFYDATNIKFLSKIENLPIWKKSYFPVCN